MTTVRSGVVLSRRTLNRTLLARQLLLERVRRPALDVVELLVGMQAQEPIDPYVGLWTRIDGFDPTELSRAIEEQQVVRMGLLRGTLHLVTARDALAQYPILADVMTRSWRSSPFAKRLVDVDLDAVVARARALLEERPMTPSELGAAMAPAWPDRDTTSLAYAARFLLPLVQVPPRGLWGRTGRPTNTTAEAWLGASMEAAPSVEDLVLRYLAVFGPASVADIACLVVAHRAARGGRWPEAALADVPRRGWPRALRRRGCADRGSGPAGTDPVPAAVRQRVPVAR